MSMDHSAIASAYDRLAERWLDDNFDRTNGMRQHEQALRFLEGGGTGWALNVGCGCNMRFHSLLRAHGLEIEGINISARMLALARAADPNVVLHHVDVRAWRPARRYRFTSAWDSIWHVALEQQRGVMRKLMGALEDGGVFITSFRKSMFSSWSSGALDRAPNNRLEPRVASAWLSPCDAYSLS